MKHLGRTSIVALATMIWASLGCSSDTAVPSDARPPRDGWWACQGSYDGAEETGLLTDPELKESSGIAASRRWPEVLWLHNDSGDTARLFATGTDGRALGRMSLVDVQARDFEDIAAGPCPDDSGPCLWVADTGNNLLDRDEVIIYATAEPDRDPRQGLGELTSGPVWRFPVAFPAGPVDIEAMMLSPDGQTLYLFEKNNLATAKIYRYARPFQADQAVVLEQIGEFESPGLAIDFGRAITAADMHASGTRFALRVYTGVYEYRMNSEQDLTDLDAVERVLVAAGPLTEPQGEAVGYDAWGDGLWTVSEDVNGNPGQPLHHYRCGD